ncbi:MAG TPA: fluoride efflux transporter CrcB [Panacibacter sp.]|nr:fluoride efflux transporter CrcB [Panacibacter sp.]HNP44377.1 fluoride efflux transporter CrcB [Panacibacter sp.]
MNSSLKTLLIVFAGSGLGGVARYGMQNWFARFYALAFPFGTFTVNLIGCLLIGLFYALSEKGNLLTPEWRMALTTGFCGGFTTFSTFAYENMNLLRTGDYLYFGLYIAGSVLLGIAAVFLGVISVKYL